MVHSYSQPRVRNVTVVIEKRQSNGHVESHAEQFQSNCSAIKESNGTKPTLLTCSAEDSYLTLIGQLTKLSLGLVEEQRSGKQQTDDKGNPQSRILDEKQGWKYVEALHKCAKIHLRNSANYHQFFVECKEFMPWMKGDIMRDAQYLADVQGVENFDEQTLTSFLEKTKDLCKTLTHWRTKLLELKTRGELLLPIQLRLQVQKDSPFVRCVQNFRDGDKFVREDEELVLLDNSNEKQWKVCSLQGEEFYVPSTHLVILGSVPEAMTEAFKLHDTYGELWTVLRGLSRKVLIKLISYLVQECDKFEDKSWRSIPREKLEKICAIVKLLEEMFGTSLSALQPGVKAKLEKLKEFLAQSLSSNGLSPVDQELVRCIIVKNADVVEDLLKLFQDSWSDKKKFWAPKNSAKNVLRAVESFEDDQEFEAVYAIDEVYKLTRAKETTEASQLSTSEQEEKQTFVITGVIDPKTKQVVSLDEAIAMGVINPTAGKYIGGPEPSQQLPIPQAMNEKLIKVEYTRKQLYEEKRSDIGVITIKSYMETRPYTIKYVVDPVSKIQLTLDEAVKKGIVNQKQNIYKDSKNGVELSFDDALEKNLFIVDFAEEGANNDQSKEQDVISYAVHSVLDTRTGQWEEFKKAVNYGLLNAEQGTYIDRTTRTPTKLADAIKKGYIKATVVADPKAFDLLPNGMK